VERAWCASHGSAHITAHGGISHVFDAAGACSIRNRIAHTAAMRTFERWNNDLTLLSTRARAQKSLQARTNTNCVRFNNSAARKKFMCEANFFAKTCCTISTNAYNYLQVTSVFAHINSQRSTPGRLNRCEAKCE
jgi:hypothetical protein